MPSAGRFEQFLQLAIGGVVGVMYSRIRLKYQVHVSAFSEFLRLYRAHLLPVGAW